MYYVEHLILYGGVPEHKKRALIYIIKISLDKVRHYNTYYTLTTFGYSCSKLSTATSLA